jgi:hypothetical protein
MAIYCSLSPSSYYAESWLQLAWQLWPPAKSAWVFFQQAWKEELCMYKYKKSTFKAEKRVMLTKGVQYITLFVSSAIVFCSLRCPIVHMYIASARMNSRITFDKLTWKVFLCFAF